VDAIEKWDSFYLIVGGAAGALIGLQFVVMTLLAERRVSRAGVANAAFATPTIVHFSMVLCLAALLRAPWGGLGAIGTITAVLGLGSVAYVLITAWRVWTQGLYKPDLEDWTFHALLPLLAYGAIAASGVLITADTSEALFGIGGATLLLLLIGIHNAWDAVAWHMANRPGQDP
jgi:hypothetical protein